MNLLLSLPPNVVNAESVLPVTGKAECVYVDSDPSDRKLGSGGGTVWIASRFAQRHPQASGPQVIIHGGGQSRRVPAYAAVGKSLTPVPVLRWATGECIDRTMLDLQLPLLKRIMEAAPGSLSTLIASGDALVYNPGPIPEIPEADVVCFGLWAPAELASHHGVFLLPRETGSDAGQLDFMLQKPSVTDLSRLARSHYYLMDVGLWLLSAKAMDWLAKRSTDASGNIGFYDLYSQFGCALGRNPSAPDSDLSNLSVAIVPLHDGRFYHFGTTPQLLSSTLSLQNLVADQRLILTGNSKPNPSLFVQNCIMDTRLTDANSEVWIENSHVGPRWTLTERNVVTGVPRNDWELRITPGSCLDIVPIGENDYALRPYGYSDPMRGNVSSPDTIFMGQPLEKWLAERHIDLDFNGGDIHDAPLFPVIDNIDSLGLLARWMISEPQLATARQLWEEAPKISATEIMERANLHRLYESRRQYLKSDLELLASNPRSVFYQLDLDDVATKYASLGLEVPEALDAKEPVAKLIRNAMLRSRINTLTGLDGTESEERAFAEMRRAILSTLAPSRAVPRLSVEPGRIVWGRSPVRIDLAGGWTDTPPYSLLHGGSVVNVALELNGQPPLQAFLKTSAEPHIILRSIDLGASETITDYESLLDFARVGSPFSIPKAALALAGFAPGFSSDSFPSLREQLREFGAGIEITLLSALPAGSGMGTSSILAATVLGALSDFCGLAWTESEICERTLALEQLLTTGGGWQDQYGGVLQGVKLLQTESGLLQSPRVSWLPDRLFTDPEYAPCHLLYYTGLTRTAKHILAEIVKRMFLNHGPSLALLNSMKEHSAAMAEAILHCDFPLYGQLVGRTWEQNKRLDSGTCPEAVAAIIHEVTDLVSGLKLPGAGGGGYLYMVAKDPEAAARIRRRLANRPNARFTEMTVSHTGLKVSRS